MPGGKLKTGLDIRLYAGDFRRDVGVEVFVSSISCVSVFGLGCRTDGARNIVCRLRRIFLDLLIVRCMLGCCMVPAGAADGKGTGPAASKADIASATARFEDVV